MDARIDVGLRPFPRQLKQEASMYIKIDESHLAIRKETAKDIFVRLI